MSKYQVVIVGGGPVGGGLAVELGSRGISCAVIERRTEPERMPKGQNLTPRTLEHFHRWGIADALRAERLLPPGFPASSITAYDNLTSEYWFAPPQREILRPYYFQDVERLPQYRTEKVLRAKTATLPSVDARYGWSADAVTQDDGGARVSVTGPNGEQETLAADFVVGCDGAHSIVREQMGIARGGARFDQTMVMTVFRSRELHQKLKRFPDRSTYIILRPGLGGYWQFFGRIDADEQFFFHMPAPPDATIENCDFLGLMHSAAGFTFACDFDYRGFWGLRVAIAETYRVGRVFIAGDAAHIHPPYGAYGLNSGLEDISNLGWKLAAVLQGWGGELLLNSYSDERLPIFQETVDDFILPRIVEERDFLERYNPERNREEFELVWNERAAGSSARVNSYEPNYEGSAVIAGPPGGRTTAGGEHSFLARAGHHLAPRSLSSGRDVFDELGLGFTLLAFDADPRPLEDAARSLHIPVKIVRDSYTDGREQYGNRLVLVRPDQHVAWAGDVAPDNSIALWRKIAGR
jgi:2-polyprenyl-6-methoxyphenol hydroxylase-like FAD-dependent oxidoreductase